MKPSENKKCKECLHRTICIAHEDLCMPDEYNSIMDCFGDCEYFEDQEPNDLLDKKCQGLLIELPVPIGSECWVVFRNEIQNQTFDLIDVPYLKGDRVFATREEAEKRLKELKKENE